MHRKKELYEVACSDYYMKKVSFSIKRKYFDKIKSGEKKKEYRNNISHWQWLLSDDKPSVAVFICGKDVHRRWIKKIYLKDPCPISGESIKTRSCIVIKLDEEYLA